MTTDPIKTTDRVTTVPREDAPRDDAPRDDAPRDDAPRDDAPRDDAPRDDAPRGDGRSRGERPEAGGELLGGAPLVVERASFGTWLRRQREGREIDLREIAEASKISMTYLKGFEEDRFDILPAPVFAKGFLRQYARYVGLDPEEVVNFYLSACRGTESQEETLEPQREVRRGGSWQLGLLVLVVVAVVAVLIWLLPRWNEPLDQVAQPPAAAGPAPEPPPRVETPAESSGAAEPSAAEPAAPEPPLLVALDFSGECWIEAYIDGERRLSEIKVQGESLLLEATEAVELKVGDVGAVQIEVNGHPFEFEAVRGSSVRTQRIDLETAAALAEAAAGRGTTEP